MQTNPLSNGILSMFKFHFQYLDAQITKYLNKNVKTEAEIEREESLVEQKFFLTEERHFVMVPAPGSGVPGAPADWDPPEGMEQHTPVLFLDLNADDFSTGDIIISLINALFVSAHTPPLTYPD